MPSYLARVASVEVGAEGVEEFVIVAPVAVRSRCVVDATGVGREVVLGGIAAAIGGAVVVAAIRGGAVVVVFAGMGADVVVTTCGGFVVVVPGAADVGAVCVIAPSGGVGTAEAALVAVTVDVEVFLTGGATTDFVAATTGTGLGAWRFCHQFQPPNAPAATRSRSSSGVRMLLLRGSGGGMSDVNAEVGTASSEWSGTAARRAASICASS